MPAAIPPPFVPPLNTLGADLCWWRETGDTHTLFSVLWYRHARYDTDLTLTFALFEDSGRLVAEWTHEPRKGQAIFVDSSRPPDAVCHAAPVKDGVLAVFASTPDPPPVVLQERYSRLYSLIDWYSDDGCICCLHNDQSFFDGSPGQEFTEIVVEETATRESTLATVNGPGRHPSGSGHAQG